MAQSIVVVDPQIPQEEQRILKSAPEALYGPMETVPEPRLGGRTGRDAFFALWQAPVWTFLPGLMGTFHGSRVRAAGLAAQAVLIGALAWQPRSVFTALVLAVLPAAFLVLLALCGEDAAGRLARLRHGHYVQYGDLAQKYRSLLYRAAKAVETVLESEVNAHGLLDDVRNTVTLPAQRWEIAQTLMELDRLTDEHEGTRADDPRVAELLAPQKEILRLATASVTERIAALEEYAAQTRAADEALEQWRTIQRLAANGDAYQELLARTVRDELALVEIGGLTEQARIVEEALRASVAKARRTGLSLVPELKAG
ncbi:hypothetical protein [Actinocorallia populi]|uniref:hypothetical protein n=1 Tax=Actinocorallia populi TaxID=2079200 RepID=UPI000D097766|nr:hypothetical protein [Actinocorallia populi]